MTTYKDDLDDLFETLDALHKLDQELKEALDEFAEEYDSSWEEEEHEEYGCWEIDEDTITPEMLAKMSYP